MTDGSGSGRDDQFESPRSARDDALGDSIEIESVTRRSDAADDLPVAESPEPRPPRRPRRPQADLSRLDAAGFGIPPPPASADGPRGPGEAPSDGSGDGPGGPGDDRAGGRGRRHLKSKKSGKSRHRAPWWELPLLVIVAIVVAILVKTYVVQPFYIPSASMENTLYGAPSHGDRILVNKPIYDLRAPHPGDIVVFNAPPGWDTEPGTTPPSNPVLRVIRGFGQLVGFVPPDGLVLVKRVIAVGGQTVKGVAVDGGNSDKVMISDHGDAGPWRTLSEPYVYLSGPDSTATFGPVTVPKGRLWVMGDHRNDSEDSRYHCGPGGSDGADGPTCDAAASTVPVGDVIGKAVLIAWPPSRWRTLGTPSTFKHDATALGGAAPLAGSALVVVPLAFGRRRRRRRAG